MGEAAAPGGSDSARAEAIVDDPLLAFVHIPRTGGGTVSSAISKNYSPLKGPGNFQKSPERTRAGVEHAMSRAGLWQAIGDHIPYGLYLEYLPPDTRYITILRDPVDRVLSHYYFHALAEGRRGSSGGKLRKTWQDLVNHERVERGDADGEEIVLPEDTDVSLEAGLRRKIPIYDNFMTRFLWGGASLFGELPSDAAERAKKNLESFWFVGVRERLDDSIVLLGRKLGIGLMPYYLRHVSAKRPLLEETPEELRRLVAEHNAMDIEVYEFARDRFEQAAPAPEELAEEVEELRRRSLEVTEAAEAARGAKREANRQAERAAKGEQRVEKREKRAQNRAENPKRAIRAARRAEAGTETEQQRRAKPRTKTKRWNEGAQGDEVGAPEAETGTR